MHKILELEIKDFRNWNHLLLEDFNKKKLCLIRGKNGSGKSSIGMALEYLLTDRLLDSSISVNDLPKRPDDSFWLRCKIECRDGKEVEIIKSRGEKYGNITNLSIDGVNVSSTTKRETQQQIFDILNINKNSLPYSTIFTQNSASFVDTADTDRKAILYDFLNLHKYNDYLNIIKTKYIPETLEEISIRKQKIENILDNLLEIEDDIEEYIRKKKEFEEDKIDRINELKRSKKDIKEEDTAWIDEEIKKLKKELVEVDDISEIEEETEKVREKLAELKKEKSILLKQINLISDYTCPVLDIHCNILETKKSEISSKNEPEIEKFEKAIKKNEKKLKILMDRYNVITDAVYRNEEIEDEIKDLNFKKKLIEEKNKNVRNSITDVEKRIREVKDEKNPYSSIIRKLKKNKSTSIEKKKEYERRIEELEEVLKYYKFWEKGFGREGIPNLKIEHILGIIEDNVNKYLSSLSGNMSIKINSQTKLRDGSARERIEYNVITPTGEVAYNTFSGGEKQRIKLANILAFADIMKKFDILILDEVLDLSLDDFGSKDVMKLLKQKSNDFGSIFVMSHKTEIKDNFNNVIDVEKI